DWPLADIAFRHGPNDFKRRSEARGAEVQRLWIVTATFLAAALLTPIFARATQDSLEPAGRFLEIRLQSESVTSGSGSSGSSHDVWTLTERVVALRDGGAELEFDLPAGASPDDRRQNWHFPARVFRPAEGPLVLLNASDAEQRLHVWLTEEERRLCGHWVFTWTSEYVDCDPQSVLGIIVGYLEPTDVREGATYREVEALEPAHLGIQNRGPNGSTLVARMEIDPDFVRHQRAQADVAIAEMTGHPPVSLETALQAHASEH